MCVWQINAVLSQRQSADKKERNLIQMTILAKDFREIARDSLRGRWGMAVGAGLVASLLGASTAITTGSGLNISDMTSSSSDVSAADYAQAQAQAQKIVDFLTRDQFVQNILPWLLGMGVVMLIWLLVNLIVGGAVTLGYAQFNLNLVDDRDPHFSNIFSHMNRLWEGFCMQFFQGMMVFLWSLLFIIPGVIASYRYSMTPYILAENMDLSVMEAITESKKMMRGNKFRLFCLELSFIGWDILAALTLNIGDLWVHPYREAARAAFYREITEARYSNPYVAPEEPDSYSWNCDKQEEPEQPNMDTEESADMYEYKEKEIPQVSQHETASAEEKTDDFQDNDIWDE